jgi:hypothetical protein
MNWRTAVCGFVTLYCLAGLIYCWLRGGDSASLWFFGIGAVLFPIVGVVHERWIRRKARTPEGG